MTCKRRTSGFTLLELLVVLTIMAILYAIVAPQVIKYIGKSNSQAAKVQVQNLAAAMELFRLDVGRYPSNDEGLKALVTQPSGVESWNGPYMAQASALKDPWGEPYHYAVPGKHGEFDIYSYGSDNAEGGEKEARDVGNW